MRRAAESDAASADGARDPTAEVRRPTPDYAASSELDRRRAANAPVAGGDRMSLSLLLVTAVPMPELIRILSRNRTPATASSDCAVVSPLLRHIPRIGGRTGSDLACTRTERGRSVRGASHIAKEVPPPFGSADVGERRDENDDNRLFGNAPSAMRDRFLGSSACRRGDSENADAKTGWPPQGAK